MKKFLTILLAFTSFFIINSCQEDGDWENGEGGQFGFKIERDSYFIEKSVGEANQLKFNVIPNYVFSTIPMKFKYTSTLNGTLTLGTQNLSPNVEYTLTNKENIFKYIGNVSGTHDLTIVVSNDKGVTKEEKFSLEYAISEFTHTYTGGTADIYQSDETPYIMKIVPASGQPSTGYEIKFNSYNGNIKLNGVAAQTGQYYPLPNIDNFNVILSTNQVGQGALDYTIKNATVNKNYNIQQTVIARKIVIESMNINALNVIPNTQMSLIGVVKKTPVTSNTSVKYKTWISASSNNNTNGIQNTNNVYTPFALGANGSFSLNFNALEVGTYTYNIQFQDEYGNESDVKSFNISVDAQLQFVGGTGAQTGIRFLIYTGYADGFLKTFKRTFKVQSGGNTTVTAMKYTIDFDVVNGSGGFLYHYQRVIDENVANGTNVYEVQDQGLTIPETLIGQFPNNSNYNNLVIKIKATNSTGATIEKVANASMIVL